MYNVFIKIVSKLDFRVLFKTIIYIYDLRSHKVNMYKKRRFVNKYVLHFYVYIIILQSNNIVCSTYKTVCNISCELG